MPIATAKLKWISHFLSLVCLDHSTADDSGTTVARQSRLVVIDRDASLINQ